MLGRFPDLRDSGVLWRAFSALAARAAGEGVRSMPGGSNPAEFRGAVDDALLARAFALGAYRRVEGAYRFRFARR